MQSKNASVSVESAPRPFARLMGSPATAEVGNQEGSERFITFRTMYSTPFHTDGDEYDG